MASDLRARSHIIRLDLKQIFPPATVLLPELELLLQGVQTGGEHKTSRPFHPVIVIPLEEPGIIFRKTGYRIVEKRVTDFRVPALQRAAVGEPVHQ